MKVIEMGWLAQDIKETVKQYFAPVVALRRWHKWFMTWTVTITVNKPSRPQ